MWSLALPVVGIIEVKLSELLEVKLGELLSGKQFYVKIFFALLLYFRGLINLSSVMLVHMHGLCLRPKLYGCYVRFYVDSTEINKEYLWTIMIANF